MREHNIHQPETCVEPLLESGAVTGSERRFLERLHNGEPVECENPGPNWFLRGMHRTPKQRLKQIVNANAHRLGRGSW